MSHTVIITPHENDQLVSVFFPAACARFEAHGQVYRLCSCNGGSAVKEFRDPIDGELLVAMRSFATEAEAKAWVAQDVAQRAALQRFAEKGRPS